MSLVLFKCNCCSYESNKKHNVVRHYSSKHININNEILKINLNDEENKINNIYLIKEDKINDDRNIYKLGKSKKILNGNDLLYQHNCYNCDLVEKRIINIFKNEFIHRLDIGFQYFEGNSIEMIKIINDEILNEYNLNNPIDDDAKLKCNKCGKILSSKRYLKNHLLICKGVSNSLECHICHKIFSHRNSKSVHLKKCKEKQSI